MTAERPLAGVTVVEAGSMIAGPKAGTMLAEFGAEVIKIEHPTKNDHLRNFGPQFDGNSLWWKWLGRNKKTVTLDIGNDNGQEVFKDLISESDVLIENFRPGTLERWNLGYEDLKKVNTDLIMARISGYGQKGPYSEKPGFGTLAEAMSGFAYLNGFEDRPPLLPPTPLADQLASIYAIVGILLALYNRDGNSGNGQCIDVSLVESMFTVTGPHAMQYDLLDEIPKRNGNSSETSAPRNIYPTKDGKWVALSASAQPLAMRTFEAIGRPDLKDDPRFKDNESRVENKEDLDDIIKRWMLKHERGEIIDIFDEHETTIAPVYNIEDMVGDNHFIQRNTITKVEDDDLGNTLTQNVFPLLSETPGKIDHLGKSAGADNQEVLGNLLGYDEELISRLRDDKVIL